MSDYVRLVSAVSSTASADSAQAAAAAESCAVPLPASDERSARYTPNWSGGFCFDQVAAVKQAVARGDTETARRIATDYLTKIATIGTVKNTYFCKNTELTQESTDFIRYLMQNGMYDLISDVTRDVYADSRAKSVSHGIYLHAMLTTVTDSISGSPAKTGEIRKVGYELVPMYRTGSHFLEWVSTHMGISKALSDSKGVGRGFRNACNAWFKKHNASNLEYQTEKYSNRKGITMKDVLALSHLKPTSRVRDKAGRSGSSEIRDYIDPATQFVLARVVNGFDAALTELDEIATRRGTDSESHKSMHLALECVAYAAAVRIVKNQDADPLTVVSMINVFGLTWEMVNNAHFSNNAVLVALLSREHMPAGDIRTAKVGLLETELASQKNVHAFVASYKDPSILDDDAAARTAVEAIDLSKAIEDEIESLKADDNNNSGGATAAAVAAGTVAPRDFERRITMPFTAFLRWLGRTSHLLERSSYAQAPMMQKMMVSHLTNADIIERSRVHPFTILAALATYRTGRGDKGSLTWPVNQNIVDALNRAMRLSFANVQAHGKIVAHLIDGSGSMRGGFGGPTAIAGVSPAELCAFMVAVSMRAEDIANHPERFYAGVFQGWGAQNGTFDDVTTKLTSTSSFDDCQKVMAAIDGGMTNMSVAFDYYKDMLSRALSEVNDGRYTSFLQLPGFVELFQLWTDNEINSGRPVANALLDYREVQRRAIEQYPRTLDGVEHDVNSLYGRHCAKLVVVCTEATPKQVGDPLDTSILSISGFDASGPQMITDFIQNWDDRTIYADE